MRFIPFCAAALLLGCPRPGAEELLKKFEQNPADVETATDLAMIGKSMTEGLLKIMDAQPSNAKIQQGGCAILAVAGDVTMIPCVEFLELGTNDDVKRRVLRVMGKGQWRSALNKFINRLDHPVIGHDIYVCLTEILRGQSIPDNPWAAEGEERMRRLAEWHQWRGKNAPLMPDFTESRYKRDQRDSVKAAIQGELNNPYWQ
jgi:hypothetical protein